MSLITRLSKIMYIRTKLIYSQMHGLEVQMPKPATDVCCECCVLLGRDVCDGTVNGREECECVCVCACACVC